MDLRKLISSNFERFASSAGSDPVIIFSSAGECTRKRIFVKLGFEDDIYIYELCGVVCNDA